MRRRIINGRAESVPPHIRKLFAKRPEESGYGRTRVRYPDYVKALTVRWMESCNVTPHRASRMMETDCKFPPSQRSLNTWLETPSHSVSPLHLLKRIEDIEQKLDIKR